MEVAVVKSTNKFSFAGREEVTVVSHFRNQNESNKLSSKKKKNQSHGCVSSLPLFLLETQSGNSLWWSPVSCKIFPVPQIQREKVSPALVSGASSQTPRDPSFSACFVKNVSKIMLLGFLFHGAVWGLLPCMRKSTNQMSLVWAFTQQDVPSG